MKVLVLGLIVAISSVFSTSVLAHKKIEKFDGKDLTCREIQQRVDQLGYAWVHNPKKTGLINKKRRWNLLKGHHERCESLPKFVYYRYGDQWRSVMSKGRGPNRWLSWDYTFELSSGEKCKVVRCKPNFKKRKSYGRKKRERERRRRRNR